jgi:hypothetical protein
MMILSRCLRSNAIKFLDPNLIAPEVMADYLIKDIGLDFNYKDELCFVIIYKFSVSITVLTTY